MQLSARATTVIFLLATAAISGCARAPRVRTAVLTPPPAVATTTESSAAAVVATRATTGDALLEYIRSRELMVPVEGVKVSQVPHTFDERRGDRPHNAHDILAKRGTPVLSADDGYIIRLSNNSLGGITIYATDPDEKLVFYYAHLERYADGIRARQKLKKGDVIGYVGSSGNAAPETPHLHFQVARMTDISRHWEGVPIDARPYFAEDGNRRR